MIAVTEAIVVTGTKTARGLQCLLTPERVHSRSFLDTSPAATAHA
jgi:hypothetical protein